MRQGIFHMALAVALLAGGGAAAQGEGSVLGSFKACASVSDGTKRLACYDSALAAADAEAASRLAEQRRAAELAAAKAAEEAKARQEQERLAAFGAANAAKADEAVKEISAGIAELREGVSGLMITLDNGQVWRQTEARTLPPVRVGDAVTIRKGVIGGYRMTFERQQRTITVKRVN